MSTMPSMSGSPGGGATPGMSDAMPTMSMSEQIYLRSLAQDRAKPIGGALGSAPFFSPDGLELFAFWNDGFVRWGINPGTNADAPPELTALPLYKPGRIYSASFGPDSLVLGMAEGAMVVPVTDIATGPGELFNIGGAQGQVSPNGSYVAFRKARPHFEYMFCLKPWHGITFAECDAEVLAEAFTPQSDELAVATYTSVTFLNSNRWERQRRFRADLDRNARLIFFR